MPAEPLDTIYQQWRELRLVEDHFDEQKASVRQLASGWLLATLGAIAFLLQRSPEPGQQIAWLVDPYMLVSIVALMGIVGITLLWIQDQLVYHRLLNSSVLLAMKMEYDHPTLPPLRSMMMIFSDKAGMAKLSRLYYLIPVLTLAAICVVASRFYFADHYLLALIFDALSVVGCIWMYRKGKTMEHFHERAQGFEEEFIEFLRSGNYVKQLERHARAVKETEEP